MAPTTRTVEPEEAIQHQSLAPEAEGPLPPFQSAKGFPLSPKPERLPALYPACLQALRDANSARAQLKLRMAKKKQAIAEIQAEIDRLEKDLALEAETRVRLHVMNESLTIALREMQGMVDDVATTVEEASRAPRTGLNSYIDKIKNLARGWRAFKARLSSKLAVQDLSRGDDKRRDA